MAVKNLFYINHTGMVFVFQVVSGGVASNQFLRQGLERVCSAHNSRLVCPPPKLCTDNGIMVAW